MIVYVVILLLVNTCSSRSFDNPVPNTYVPSVSTALAFLAKSCESPLATLINNTVEECSVASPSYTVKTQFECLLFLDINSQLCKAIAKNQIVVPKENIMVKIMEPVNIERMCTSAKDWKPSVLAAYPQYNATVLKNDMKCAIVCSVEDVTSQDSNFFCKYYKWGMDLLSRSNSVTEQADHVPHVSEKNPNPQYQLESGSHSELDQKLNLQYQQVSGLPFGSEKRLKQHYKQDSGLQNGLEQKLNPQNQQESGLHTELEQKLNPQNQQQAALHTEFEQKLNLQNQQESGLDIELEQKLNPQNQQKAGLHTRLEQKLNPQNQQESGLHTGLEQNPSQQNQQESALHYATGRANVASSKDLAKSTEIEATPAITSGQQTHGVADQQGVGSHANSELNKQNSAEEVDSVQQSPLANQNLTAKDPAISSGPGVLSKGQNIAQSESKDPVNNAESVSKLSGGDVMKKNASTLQEQTGQNGNLQSEVNAGADYSDPGDYDSDLDNLVNMDKKINVDKTKQASKTSKGSYSRSFGETDKNIIMPDFSDDDEDHFFSFFLTVIVMVVLLYILYHNKNKVSKLFFGLLVEGRQSRRRSSRGHAYRRLDTLEQAMSTNSAAPPSKIIY